jgi:excinuclease ABC subunit C
LISKNQQLFDTFIDVSDAVMSYLVQYYTNNMFNIKKVLVEISDEQIALLNNQFQIKFHNSKTAEEKKIINLSRINSKNYFLSNKLIFEKEKNDSDNAFDELKTITQIENLYMINVFDMANLFDSDKVGGMITLIEGKFSKNLYRKYIIKDQNAKGDTQYMSEVIKRRYKDLKDLPNLIIVDGGYNQINATYEALKELKLENIIPILGLKKDSSHKTNCLIFNNKEIELDRKSSLYFYLFKIQEEVHRFTITFFRNRKSK